MLREVEVVICGGYWKAWGWTGKKGYNNNQLITSEDGHKTAAKALAQLRYRARKIKEKK